MKSIIYIFLFLPLFLSAQDYYFPPSDFNTWEQSELVCDDSAVSDLVNFLEEKNTKAFIILKKGKLLQEHYFGDFVRDSIWYWASAGKTVAAVLIGMAEADGDLSIDDPTENYLDQWTNCLPGDQTQITIRHQLTMTTGLDENISFECTSPECLECLHEPGTRWFYHNGPYTLLQDVYESATGLTANQGFNQRIGQKIGAIGGFIPSVLNDNKIFFSRPRDMARFGLLVAANGNWDGTEVYPPTNYFEAMRNTSQELNKAYGYLWWLNGKESYHLPITDFEFSGALVPNAPADMYAALGKNDQKIYIVPSEDLVVVRMGNAADDLNLAISTFDDELWEKINHLNCLTPTGTRELANSDWEIYPNPTSTEVFIHANVQVEYLQLVDSFGQLVFQGTEKKINTAAYPAGFYQLKMISTQGEVGIKSLVIY